MADSVAMVCRNDECPAYDADDDARQQWRAYIEHDGRGSYYRRDSNHCPACGAPGETK